MLLDEQLLTRRSLCALALTPQFIAQPAWPADSKYEKVRYTRTASGLLYFDKPRGSGFDDRPCRAGCLETLWAYDPADPVDDPSAPVLNGVGKEVIIDYRVRRGGPAFDGDPVALSDGQNGGSILFVVGDGTVNAAVDELVRTLPPKRVRRAVVPAAFDLDHGTRTEYPRPEPPGTTYLELKQWKWTF